MYSNVLDFCASNPWTAFWLAWPTALVLISVAWSIAGVCEATLRAITTLVSLLVVAIRGPLVQTPPPDKPLAS